MKLYNTLTRKIDDFQPIKGPKVKVYTCGPTVYDYAHIGHWFTFVRADTLIRTLKANGLAPVWVMNITDVGHLVSDADEGEDKVQAKAQREGKTAWEIAEFYIDDFKSGIKSLNINEPDQMPRATDYIKQQIDLIQRLETKGFTYRIDDGIYYDTNRFPRYADFAKLDLNEQQAGARVELNPEKRQPWDFALWKFSPKNQTRDMEWNSPWGKGFPGWHIECSAMSMHFLGETLDIHTGGIDHIPVHHTNEIAQSEAATGVKFANYWVHANHVMVDGQKISKSLGNGIRLEQILEKGIPSAAFRLLILESHYRTQAHFTWDNLTAANNRLKEFQAMAALRWQPRLVAHDSGTFALEDVPRQLAAILADDLDTPQALAFLSGVATQLNTVHIEKDMVDHFEIMLRGIDDLLGLNLTGVGDITDSQKKIIAEREAARQKQNWSEADRLRKVLEQNDIGVHDLPHGPIWYPL